MGSLRKDKLVKTLEYYERNAKEFIERTKFLEVSYSRNKFLTYLPPSSLLLDLGCGSGRDSVFFLSKGHQIVSCDGSKEICILAEKNIGRPVQCRRFDEIREQNIYDGIWANACLLHLPSSELVTVLNSLSHALKPLGILYMSFKYGDFSGIRDERYFLDMNEYKFNELITKAESLDILESFITKDTRFQSDERKWFNVILRKR